jgi:glucose/arabinose dehydrogenase
MTVASPGRLLALTVVPVLLAAACADGGEEDLPSDTRAPIVDPTVPSTAVPPPSSSPRPVSVDSVAGVTVGLEEVVSLDQPVAMAVRPGGDDHVYVGERGGVVLRLGLDDGTTSEVLDISDETTTDGERGLLGLAVSLDGSRLYVSSTDLDGNTRIDEYGLAADGSVDEGSQRPVFTLDQPFSNHNGGQVVFGPDGMLYVGLGDGGSAGDPLEAGQDHGQLLGSILRIDPTGGGDSAYATPADNPFVDEEGGRPEVWLKGVRNPWRFTFDRVTGDLWVGDVGQGSVEEVDWLPAQDGEAAGRGANLGWNQMEGDQPFEDGVEPDDHTPPVFTYTHDGGGCAVTGGYRYRGTAIPELAGAYLWADYCTGEVGALAVDDEGHQVVDDAIVATATDPISFGEGPHGELYLLTEPGPLYRLTPG